MTYKAKVVAKTTVNNESTKIGDVVDVDFNTLRNLAKKGRLKPIEDVPGVVFIGQPEPETKKEGK